MTLPGAPTRFLIAAEKLTAYLLNPAHPRGGAKARFFLAFGFVPDAPEVLARSLLAHADPVRFAASSVTPRGHVALVFEGVLVVPDGRDPRIRSVWQVDEAGIARLVTAVPLT
ncbi:DUF6883 domain-containing protein [Methylobacterium sp. A54F]